MCLQAFDFLVAIPCGADAWLKAPPKMFGTGKLCLQGPAKVIQGDSLSDPSKHQEKRRAAADNPPTPSDEEAASKEERAWREEWANRTAEEKEFDD